MALHAPTGTLRVATHGRGIWEIAAGTGDSRASAALASPTIGLGGGPTLLSGFIKAGSLVPPGSVDITVNGVTQSAPITPGTGFFASSFATSGLAAGRLSDRLRLRGSLGIRPGLGAANADGERAAQPPPRS